MRSNKDQWFFNVTLSAVINCSPITVSVYKLPPLLLLLRVVVTGDRHNTRLNKMPFRLLLMKRYLRYTFMRLSQLSITPGRLLFKITETRIVNTVKP